MLLERAKQRYEAGRGGGTDARQQLESALDALHLAYQLGPAPWLLFNLAQVQSRLGACHEATDLYQRFLASDPAPEARASAEEALGLLGSCEEANREPAPGDGLPPGLRLWLGPDSSFLLGAARPAALPTAGPSQPEEAGRTIAAVPWVFGGLSVMSGAAGLVFYHEAHTAKHDLDQLRIAGPNVAATRERGESAQDLARAFGGLAVGFALAAGVSYWWLASDPEAPPVVTALERIAWLPLQGGAGAAYRVEF